MSRKKENQNEVNAELVRVGIFPEKQAEKLMRKFGSTSYMYDFINVSCTYKRLYGEDNRGGLYNGNFKLLCVIEGLMGKVTVPHDEVGHLIHKLISYKSHFSIPDFDPSEFE